MFTKAQIQVDAIFALENMELTENRKLIRQAIHSGKISNAQAYDELLSYIKANKTVDGFVESRSWINV